MNSKISPQVLDKHFILAASVIGTIYAILVVTLGSLIGKEAAGVAGVALTAIATGIFKQFETLRFRRISQEEKLEIQIPTLSWWGLVVFASAFVGLKFFFGMLLGLLMSITGLMPQVSGMESFLDLLLDWKVLFALVGINFFVYALGGFAIAKAVRIRAYSTLLIAAFLSCLLDGLLPFIPVAIQNFGLFVEMLTSGALWPAAFWLFFVGAALLGARLGNRKSVQPLTAPTET